MSHERSDSIHRSYLETHQKFDYFMISVAVALVGYLGPQFKLVAFDLSRGSIEMAALACFLMASIAGIKRVESTLRVLQLNFAALHAGESAGTLMKAADNADPAGGPLLNVFAGETFTPHEAKIKAANYRKFAGDAKKEIDTVNLDGLFWMRCRNRLLVFGLGVFVVSRFFA